MLFKIMKLPKDAQHLLVLAACIGNKFSLKTIAELNKKSLKQTNSELWSILKEGLIIPCNSNYKYLTEGDDTIEVTYRFLHDRVQQSAYSLIKEDKKAEIHLKIGRILKKSCSQQKPNAQIFDIVNHLNRGSKLIIDKAEKLNLIELNLIAGKRAKNSAAWPPALDYFDLGINLLEKNSWKNEYELTLSLYIEASEAFYLNNDGKQTDKIAQIALKNAKTLLDKIKIYEIMVHSYNLQKKPLEALNVGLKALKELGIKFPQKPSKIFIMLKFLKTQYQINKMDLDQIHKVPEMTDQYKIAACRILVSIGSAAYIVKPSIVPLITFKLCELFVKHGNNALSAFSFAAYGIMLCGYFKRYQLGYKMAQAALILVDQANAKFIKAKILYLTSAMIKLWEDPYQKFLSPLLEGYRTGLEIGDFEFAAYSCYAYCFLLYFIGTDLMVVEKKMENFGSAIHSQKIILSYLLIYHQTVLNLIGKTENPCYLIGKKFNEKIVLKSFLKEKNESGIFEIHFNKLMLCYLFHKYNEAIKNAKIAVKYLFSVLSKHNIILVYFYFALTLCAIFQNASKKEKRQYLKKIRSFIKKMENWALLSPHNCQNKLYLMKAELSRVTENKFMATDYYNKAISLSINNGYLQEEALCYELLAKLNSNNADLYNFYLKKAYYKYNIWGAKAKCLNIQKEYPQIELEDNSINEIRTSNNKKKTLDLESIIKASQAISSEILPNKLYDTLINIIVENAGAEDGLLILKQNNIYSVLVKTSSFNSRNQMFSAIRIDGYDKLPKKIINYVIRSKEPIVLNDAIMSDFSQDEYIKTQQPKSIICLPIIGQNDVVGLLYLENNLITNAFKPNCVQILQPLSSQAAISIINANLFQNLEKSFRTAEKSKQQYKNIFDNAIEGIFQTSVDGRIIEVNPALVKIFGYTSKKEITDSRINIANDFYVNLSDRKFFINTLDRFGVIRDFEAEFRRKDGKIITGLINAHAIYNKNKDFLHYEGTFQDITEKKITENLKIEKETAEAKAAARSMFVANMGHELRTPLNTIIGYSQLLSGNLTKREIKSYSNKIMLSGRWLLNLIDDVLDYSKFEIEGININCHPLSIIDIAEEVKNHFLLIVKQKGLRFNILIDPSLKDTVILFDKKRLMQILFNLIQNSYKYTDTGYIELGFTKIELGNIADRIGLIITVNDSGIGISDTNIIFEEFKQESHRICNMGTKGIGLGLSIVKKLVKMMQGSITVESDVGKGSKFRIEFKNIKVISNGQEKSNNKTSDKLTSAPIIEEEKFKIIKSDVNNLLCLSEILSTDILKKKNNILKNLEQIKDEIWEQSKRSLTDDCMMVFANAVKDTGLKHDVIFLVKWGDELNKHIADFDITKMEIMLNQFPKIIQKIKEFE